MLKDWMSYLSEKSRVIDLIQHTLGCGCPEEVFDHYLVCRLEAPPIALVKMIIGERLLVYLVPHEETRQGGLQISELLRQGQSERDSRGLNRFRLVVVGTLGQIRPRLEQEVRRLHDPKVHLHLIRSISGS